MTLNDFVIEAKKAVYDYLKETGINGIRVEYDEVVKANDMVMHGLVLISTATDCGPNVYLDDLFLKHEEGTAMEDIIPELEARCRDSLLCQTPPDPDPDLSLGAVRSRLTVRLLDVRLNMSYMTGRPYIDVGNGLALIAEINSEEKIASEWKITVTDNLLPEIGCSKEELLTAALENTIAMEPPLLLSLRRCVEEDIYECGQPDNLLDGESCCAEDEGMLVLTNSSKIRGASALFYPSVQQKITEVTGGGYYVIPSSVHEVIVVPDSFGAGAGSLKEMLRHGNMEVTDTCDILSDRIFHYAPDEGRLTIAA